MAPLRFSPELALITLSPLSVNVPPLSVIVPVPASRLVMPIVPAAVSDWLPDVALVSVVSPPPTVKGPLPAIELPVT